MNSHQEDILLLFNESFFERHGVVSVKDEASIPDKDCVLFIGDHKQTFNPNKNIAKYFDAISVKPFNYSVILGKTDLALDINTEIPTNIKKIYCNNIDYSHDIIKFLPMGRDFRARKSFDLEYSVKKRDILVYANFSLNTHWTRKAIHLFIKDNPLYTLENIGLRGQERFKRSWFMSNDDFFKRLMSSKFVICPRGTAPDSFRFYDTLHFGAIPIVVKDPMYDQFDHSELPILFLDHQKDFQKITENFLNEQYNILSKKIKPYYTTLDFNHWVQKIKNI
jgi:hypothetical protein